jgi:flavin reductase (DIM6/NTAB) family NADH-FMN oxidoreductase RutF
MKRSLGAKTIVGATSVWVVGTYDGAGKPNLMTAAWGGVCCSDPPCVGVSLRKATYSYGSIKEQKAFTVNIPSAEYMRETDYVGIASGRNKDKWLATGLTPVRGDLVNAPYVAEFPLVLECKLKHVLDLGLHTQFVGEILDVKAEESILGEQGDLDIEKVDPFFYVPGSGVYRAVGRYLARAHSVDALLERDRE